MCGSCASVTPLVKPPISTSTLSSAVSFLIALMPASGFSVSSATTISSFLPSTPPLALTSSIAICTASCVSRPTCSCTAVGTPMRMGPCCATASGAWASMAKRPAPSADVTRVRRFIAISSSRRRSRRASLVMSDCANPGIDVRMPRLRRSESSLEGRRRQARAPRGTVRAPPGRRRRPRGKPSGGLVQRLHLVEGLQQLRALLPRRSEMARLDMTEAADLLRHRRDAHGDRQVVAREAGQQFADRALVLLDERTLLAALLGTAEDVEGSAAQAAQLRQRAKGLHHPGTILALDELALAVAPGEQRRREMEAQADVALELALQLLPEAAVGE